tara:strand:- start:289 stop:480 length:192 start_codon:yes stop_codon:yes gene_type:complete
MKVKLSEQASTVLLDLYQRSGEEGNITHFLNKLICSQQNKIQLPFIEDINNGRKPKPSMPALQ